MNPDEPKPLNVPSFAAHSTRGIIRERKSRRVAMFVSLVVAVSCLAVATLIDAREHLLIAAICWLACAWMTVIAVLLAIYDLLVVRRDSRAQTEKLRRDLD